MIQHGGLKKLVSALTICLLATVFPSHEAFKIQVVGESNEPITIRIMDAVGVLVFSKTEGYRHASIEAGKKAFSKMATDKGFAVDLLKMPNNLKRQILKIIMPLFF